MATFAAGQKVTASALNNSVSVIIGGQSRSTATPTTGTTELQVVTTAALSLDANSLYDIEYSYNGATNSSIVERWAQRIRKTNVSGTQLSVHVISAASTAADPEGSVLTFLYITTAPEVTTFVGTIARLTSNSGTNTLTNSVLGDCFITVTRQGSNTVVTTV
jgi:hypothetical protein